MSRRAVQIAVLLPLVGLMLLIVRAETAQRKGPTFEIVIAGFDPRDLLHGHFLRYRYVFNWQGPHSCGESPDGDPTLATDCCLCLTTKHERGFDPEVQQLQCGEIEPGLCDGVLKSSSVMSPQKYFIPEEQARLIERAVFDGSPSLELTCGLDQTPAIRALLIDGVPWHVAIGVNEPEAQGAQ